MHASVGATVTAVRTVGMSVSASSMSAIMHTRSIGNVNVSV